MLNERVVIDYRVFGLQNWSCMSGASVCASKQYTNRGYYTDILRLRGGMKNTCKLAKGWDNCWMHSMCVRAMESGCVMKYL